MSKRKTSLPLVAMLACGAALAPLSAQAGGKKPTNIGFETGIKIACEQAMPDMAPEKILSQSSAATDPALNIQNNILCAKRYAAELGVRVVFLAPGQTIANPRTRFDVFQQTGLQQISRHVPKPIQVSVARKLTEFQDAFKAAINLGARTKKACIASADMPWQNDAELCVQLRQNIREMTGRDLEFYLPKTAPQPPRRLIPPPPTAMG